MTLEMLVAAVETLAIEVGRHREMLQALSESVDQNRREVQVATATAVDLHGQLAGHISQIQSMGRDMVALVKK